MREPIEVVYTHLDSKIGQPEDISKNIASEIINFDQEIPIPSIPSPPAHQSLTQPPKLSQPTKSQNLSQKK